MTGQQELIEIQPEKIKFTFEPKKHSSCTIKLSNRSTEYVGFKVKTTNPKKYCVQPNSGVILPRATREFTVTMLAQKETPDNMQIKDRFLVQGTVVPHGSTDEDIASTLFSKDSGYIQENKMRVVLVSPTTQPADTSKQETSGPSTNEETRVVNDDSMKTGQTCDNQIPSANSVSHSKPKQQEPPFEVPASKNSSSSTEATKQVPVPSSGNSKFNGQAENAIANVHPTTHFAKNVDELKKLHLIKFKLIEADKTIERIKIENKIASKERDKLQKEMVALKRTRVGFSFLFVVFIAFFDLVLGYLLHQ